MKMMATVSRLQTTCCRLLSSQPCAIHTQVRCFSDAADGPKQKQVKVKKKEKKSGDTESQRSKELSVIMAALDAPVRKEPPISEEEKARRFVIGRNYTIGRFRFHNETEHDLTCKIRMKQHAIKMLPRGSTLKEEALKISEEMPPAWRPIPVWTPPIPGFDPSLYIVKEEDKM
jgi:Mitochondrial ribosomal protein L28